MIHFHKVEGNSWPIACHSTLGGGVGKEAKL